MTKGIRKKRWFSGKRLGFAALGASFLSLLTGCQRQFVYFPTTASESLLQAGAEERGLEPWESAQEELIGWKTSGAREGVPNVVVFPGNAGYALQRTYFVQGFRNLPEEAPWNVYLFEYPGYGARPGKPSEGLIKEAALEAVSQLLDDGKQPLVLVGESLGTGVAAWLAGQRPKDVSGILLITPYTNLLDVGQHHYPFLPVSAVLRERYDSVEALKHYDGPVAIVLAGKDKLISPKIGKRLYDSYDGPKRLWVQEESGHRTLNFDPSAPWWQEVADFLQQGE